MTLSEAAAELGHKDSASLRMAIRRGKLVAEMIGNIYVVTRVELERYRAESAWKQGRPKPAAE